ncbi:hypothetical protein BaRGS_00023187, partial [Batillaria attramentaria]
FDFDHSGHTRPQVHHTTPSTIPCLDVHRFARPLVTHRVHSLGEAGPVTVLDCPLSRLVVRHGASHGSLSTPFLLHGLLTTISSLQVLLSGGAVIRDRKMSGGVQF